MNKDIVIIGAGASALMLAALMPKNRVTLIESNPKPAAKILISGGGKCNITNARMGAEYYLGDRDFIAPVLKRFNEKKLLQWLERQGVEPVLRNASQYFCKESARELVDIFEKELKRQKLFLNETVKSVVKHGETFEVMTNNRTLRADAVVVASGGLSFPKIGASPIGYEIAEAFGHRVVKTAPGLVGFTVQREQFFFKELSGVSCDVEIVVNGARCQGALLFAHKGISGPAVLDASLFWEKGRLEIDFLPGFNWKVLKGSRKLLSTLLPLPKRVTKAFLVQLKLHDKTGMEVTSDELRLLQTLNHYSFAPAGTFGYTKAEVTKGGIDTDEIDADSMMSKRVQGLFFIGEVLNVTGRLGGYNFQWAFASAYTCAASLKRGI